MLTEEQVTSTLDDLAAQKVKQAFVHPRPGLMTPYLSADWFRLWKTALREAERLDMNLWIYDENSYPSGFAGGWVPELMPAARGQGLFLSEVSRPTKPGGDVLGIYRLRSSGFENVIGQARAGEPLPEARYLLAAVKRADNSPWFGNRCYVDLMYPGATEKFLEVTLEAYRREIGGEFGKRVPGSFSDEPNLHPAGGLPWSEHLDAEFQKRWGYSLIDHLPCLVRPVGDWKKVRHDYYRVLLEQFIEHWSRPYHDYCEKHGLEWTGHYWDHEWPNCQDVPDNMAMYAWHQRPAIDCLRNQYREDTHAQFGNLRMVRELGSVANQLGCKRTLCEVYGAGGWDLRFEDMKRIGDWLEVLGVNTLDQHLSYISMRGARKADYPQSFSYHEPWWPAYHVLAQYFARLSAALSHGEQINGVLVIEPTTTAWMYQGDETQLAKIAKDFCDLLMSLEQAEVDYDIGCEDVIARHGRVQGGALVVGKRKYREIVVPPETETLDAKTVDLLEALVAGGGEVLCCGPAPSLVDGGLSKRCQALAEKKNWSRWEPANLVRRLGRVEWNRIVRSDGDNGVLFHQRREFDDGFLLFLVNTSLDSASSGVARSLEPGRVAERWELETGTIVPGCGRIAGPEGGWKGRCEVPFNLPPGGSLLLFFRKGEEPPKGTVATNVLAAGVSGAGSVPHALYSAPIPTASEVVEPTTIRPAGAPQVRRCEPNVLTLDYIDLTAGGETKTGLYFHRANQLAFAANGMPQNPWDSAVQFKNELITKRFPPTSGFQAAYHFTIVAQTPKPLEIVIERPDLYTIACNGTPVAARKGAWWLDKAFGRIDITAAARVGENVVTIAASPMTIFHELEPAYLLGDFQVQAAAAGFVLAPAKPLDIGPWDRQGHPFYAAGASYGEEFDLPHLSGRYRVSLGAWYGSVARVTVNGKEAGYVGWQPWECEVTDLLKPGSNTIEVTVIGTLKNTLGPHHAGRLRGAASPTLFHQGPETGPPPGAAYDTIGYGLFEPFVLKQAM